MKIKLAFLLGCFLLLTGAMAVAQDSGILASYFATTPNDPAIGPWVVVAQGPGDQPGPFVDVASITISKGSYLLTARLNVFSYMGNAGVDCGFRVNHADPPLGGDRLAGKGDGSIAGSDKSTFLGKYTGNGGLLTISCQKTYGATDWEYVNGTMTAVRVVTVKSNP